MAAANHFAQEHATPQCAHLLHFGDFLDGLARQVLVGQHDLDDLGGQVDQVTVLDFGADDPRRLQYQRVVPASHAQDVAGLQHGGGIGVEDLVAAADALDEDARLDEARLDIAHGLADPFGMIELVGAR